MNRIESDRLKSNKESVIKAYNAVCDIINIWPSWKRKIITDKRPKKIGGSNE
jgi:hypothetical protein